MLGGINPERRWLWSDERVGQGVDSREILCEIGAEVVTLGQEPRRVVGDRHVGLAGERALELRPVGDAELREDLTQSGTERYLGR